MADAIHKVAFDSKSTGSGRVAGWPNESPRNGSDVWVAGGLRVVATIVTAASDTTPQFEQVTAMDHAVVLSATLSTDQQERRNVLPERQHLVQADVRRERRVLHRRADAVTTKRVES
jgi:hypothetical protein